MQTLTHSPLLDLGRPRTLRTLAVAGLLLFSLFAGYAATQESARYPAAVVLFVVMVLFRKWQEPYVLALAVLLFLMSGSEVAILAEKGLTYRWHGLFLLLGVGGLRMLGERNWVFQVRPLFLGMIAWGIYLVWSTVWSPNIAYSFPRSIAICIILICAFFTIFRYMEKGWPSLNNILISLTWLHLGFLCLQFLPGGASNLDGRYAGIMNHVNALGGIVVLTIPLGLYVLLDAPVRWMHRVAGGILFVQSCVLLVLCASRSSIVGAGVAVLLYIAIRNPYRLALGAFLLALVLAVLVGYDFDLIETFHLQTLVRPETLATGTNRTTAWAIALYMHKFSPVWGHGYFSGEFLIQDTAFNTTARLLGFGHFHNSYLDILVDLGWLGAFPFLLFIGYCVVMWFRRGFHRRENPTYRRTVIGLGFVLLAGMLHAIFESWLLQPGNITTLTFWTLFAAWLYLVLEPDRFPSPSTSREEAVPA